MSAAAITEAEAELAEATEAARHAYADEIADVYRQFDRAREYARAHLRRATLAASQRYNGKLAEIARLEAQQ